MTMERALLVMMCGLLVWFSSAIIRLENYHYASQIGMCAEAEHQGPLNLVARDRCLNRQQTRTNPLWHLLYGLRVL
jgi:hypothetical protein